MTSSPTGRFVGAWPKIGIRPAIDGRMHGVRESLEAQTTAMARRTADLIAANLRYPDGTPVEVRRPRPQHRRRLRGGQGRRALPRRGRRRLHHDHARAGATAPRRWTWTPSPPRRSGASTAPSARARSTSRPSSPPTPRRACPRSASTAATSRTPATRRSRPTSQAKILRFAKAGLAAAILRGKSYLSLGGVSMGIAGSIVDQPFFEKYLGMRVECVDMSELARRLEEGIYDPVELAKGLAWAKANCPEGADRNPAELQKSRAEKDHDWETVVKMTLITRDLLVGNPRLAELGFGEEAMGRNAILGGFQGQRALDRPLPQRRLHGGDPQLLASTGTGSAPRTSSRPRTTASTARRCCSATCSRTGPRSSPTSAPTGAPRPSSASPVTTSRASPRAASSTSSTRARPRSTRPAR